VKPVEVAASAMIPVIVPGSITFCDVKEKGASEKPVAAEPVYAMPERARERVTWPGALWTKVNGEPAGVQTLPTLLLVQAPAVPTPAKMFCRSKLISPPAFVKTANCGMLTAPVVGGPMSGFRVADVTPTKEPVSGPVITTLLNVTPALLTVTVPAMFASLGEISVVADAADTKSNELTPISPSKDKRIRPYLVVN
jgi:hypothetical protein